MSAGNSGTNVLDRVAGVFGIINNAALCIYLSHQHYQAYFGETTSKFQKAQQTRLRKTRSYQLLHLLSFISIVFSVFFCVVRTIIAFDAWNNNCTFSTGFAVSLWQVTKSALYLYFVIRFEVAFQESSYALSKLTLRIFYGAIIIQWIAAEILIIAKWHGEIIPPVTGQCVGLPPIYIIAFFSIWDVICTIGLSVLFSTKLCAVHRGITKQAGPIKKSFVHTIIKVLVLSVFACFTTILCTFGVSQSGITAFIITDTVINCWCIFLMYAKNGKVFKYCCCGLCTRCCLRCFLKKEAQRLGLKVDEMMVASPTGDSSKMTWGKQATVASNSELQVDSSVRDTSNGTNAQSSNMEATLPSTPEDGDMESMDTVI